MAKSEIGEYLIEEILNSVGEASSPVKGYGKFRGLSKNYKKKKMLQSSSVIPNMELTGDLLDSLTFQEYRDGIEVGIFDPNEALKADNHNKFSSKSLRTKVPKRRFIPDSQESFKSGIMRVVKNIVKEIHGEGDDQ